jgi:hypothetical protein
MPEPSTFRNHDPPRGQHAFAHGRRAAGRGGRRGLRGFPGDRDALSEPSACAPAPGRRWSSRHVRDHTDGGSETGPCRACIGGCGFPVDLDEVEELDTITIWPHLAWGTSLCGTAALPMKARSCELRAFVLSTVLAARQPRPRSCPPPLLRPEAGTRSPVILVETGPRHAGGDMQSLRNPFRDSLAPRHRTTTPTISPAPVAQALPCTGLCQIRV